MKKFKFLLPIFLVVAFVVSFIPVYAGGYDVKFEVMSTSPIGATIRVTIDSSPYNVQMVVLNLEDIQNGIKPEDARQQEIKYSEVNQITLQDKEYKIGIMGERDITIDDVISKASEPLNAESENPASKYSKATIDYLTSIKVATTSKDVEGKDVLNSSVIGKTALVSTFGKVPKEVKSEVDTIMAEMPQTITDIVSYDVKVVKEEVKKELVKNKSPTTNQGFIVDKPMTLEATITSGSFYDANKGWGSSGVLALIINGQYYYDMSNSSWWSTAYAHRMSFTIDKTNVSADLTNFPVKLWLSSASGISSADITAIFTNLTTNSLKIAVTDSTSTTQCYVEVVSWSYDAGTPANSTAELYVNVPNVYTASDTVIYFYYDATQSNNSAYVGVTTSTPAKAVWDSDFKAVYHMNNGVDNAHIYDSTTNANHGTKKGANEPIEAAGLKGKAQSFDANDDYILIPQAVSQALTGNSYATVEVFLKTADVDGTEKYIFDIPTSINNARLSLRMSTTLKARQYVRSNAEASALYTTSTNVINDNTDRYIATIANLLVGDIRIYNNLETNNEAKTFAQNTFANNTNATNRLSQPGAASCIDGLMNEIRLSISARSAPWIKATNYSERDTAGTWGSEVSISIPSVTTSAVSSIEVTTVTLNGDVTNANNGDLTTRGFQWGTSTGVYLYSWSEASVVTGVYTHAETDVLSGIVYFRAFAVNQAGTGYGSEVATTIYPSLPTGFLATISGDDLILTWTKGIGATDTTIVRSFAEFPTSLTDGATVYDGTGTTVTIPNVNGQSPQYFFSAWSENALGYSTLYANATNGGMVMYLVIFLIAGAVFAALAWKFRGYVMGIFAGALIIFAALYTRSTPIPNITVGGPIDTAIFLILLAFGIMTALISLGKFIDSSDGRSIFQRAFGGGAESQKVISYSGDSVRRTYNPNSQNSDERIAAYRTLVRSKLYQRRTKK